MDFLFEIKSFYFSILQIHTCYFSDKRTYKKRMLEGRMVTRKNSYIKYVFASIHPLRDTPHGNHRLLSYSFSIAFRGAILPALRPPTQKSFSPGARWRIALTPRAMPLFTIGRNTISKRLNDVSMGPSLDKTNASTAQGNKLYGGTSTLPNCTSTIADADILYMTRVQRERFFNEEDYIRLRDSYILTAEKLNLAPADMAVLHPLPRVNEITLDVDDDPRAAYFEQAQNGVYVRMALIMTLLGLKDPKTGEVAFEC